MTAQTRPLPLLGMLLALVWAAPAHAQWELEIPLEEGVIRPAPPDPTAPLADDGAEEAEVPAEAEAEPTLPGADALEAEAWSPEGRGQGPGDLVRPGTPEGDGLGEAPPATSQAGAAAEAPKAPRPQDRRPGLSAPAATPRDLAAHWAARRARLADRDLLGAESEAQATLDAARELGIPALPRFAEAVVLEGLRALERNDPMGAAERADLAKALAPAHPAAHWLAARVALASRPPAVSTAVSEAFTAARLDLTAFPQRRATGVAAGGLVLGAGVLAAGLLLLGAAVRSIRPFLHDLHHRLPAGSLVLVSGAAGGLLLILPWALGLGAALWVVALALMSWSYLSQREQWVLAGAVATLLAAPMAAGSLADRLVWWGTPAADVARLESTGDWAAALPRLRARVEAGGAPWEVRYAVARADLRTGQWAGIEGVWEALLAERPGHPGARTNLGVARYAQGDLAGATTAFQAAVEDDAGLAAAWHDLARARFAAADLAGGTEAGARARALDPALVEARPAEATRLNRVLATVPLTPTEIARVAKRPGPGPRRVLGDRFAGPLPPGVHPWLALGGLALVAGGGSVLARRRRATRCERCGGTVCARCVPEVGDEAICGQCLTVTRADRRVQPAVRAAKAAQAQRHHRRRVGFTALAGAVIPGATDLLQGRTLRGVALLFAAALAVAGGVLGAWVPQPSRLGAWLPGLPEVGVALAVVVWPLAWWRLARTLRRGGAAWR